MAFGKFKVIAGDFNKSNEHQFVGETFIMGVPGKFFREDIPAENIEEIEIASEENVKKMGGTVGWGIAGVALLGPLGLLAGLMLGGKGKDVTFICKFKDGRKFMAVASSKIYTNISAAQF